MPYLFLFLSLLAAVPGAAEENAYCKPCNPLYSNTEYVVMRGTTGYWSIWRQNSSEQHCLRPAKAGQFYRFDGSSKTSLEQERIYVGSDTITADQATVALQHKDSIVFASYKTTYSGFLSLMVGKVKSGIEYFIDEGNKVIMPMESEVGLKRTVDPLMAINVLLMFLFAGFCAIASQGKKEIHNPVYLTMGGIFVAISLTFLTIESIALFQTAITTWPMKLLLANLGFSFGFLVLVATTIKDDYKRWLDPENRFDKKGTIRGCVIPLGIFYLVETIFFVGWRTSSWQAMLWYAGLAAIPFLIFNGPPAVMEFRKKIYTEKKIKRTIKAINKLNQRSEPLAAAASVKKTIKELGELNQQLKSLATDEEKSSGAGQKAQTAPGKPADQTAPKGPTENGQKANVKK